MDDWRRIEHEEIDAIERVAAIFEVRFATRFPYGKVKIKILEETTGDFFTGLTNVAAKSKLDGTPDWIAGVDKSVAKTLEATINNFLGTIVENGAIDRDDFIWAQPEVF